MLGPTEPGAVRYEVLPFPSVEREVRTTPRPLTLSLTCSPTHGPDHTVDVACRLHELGHSVVVHLAARTVQSHKHLDRLLARMRAHGLDHVFLVGGDATKTGGPFKRGLDLLPVLRDHANAPKSIGVPAYPEGHPLIEPGVLRGDLRRKARHADYMTTQLCFNAGAVVRWLADIRADGIELPTYVGLPGMIDRKRLLEISLRVGVGASISFLRKQHGITNLAWGSKANVARQLHAEIAPLIGGELGVTGLNIFTFNRVGESVRLVELGEHAADEARDAARPESSA